MKKLLLLLLPVALMAQPATPINNARITGTSSAVTLGIGTGSTTAATNFQVVDTGTGTPRGITDDQYNTGTNSAQLNLRKARGTFAAPTTIVTGDVLSRLISWGHDGSNFIETGNLRFTSNGTIAATRVPSEFSIWTSTNAAPSVLTQQFTVTNSGQVLVGGLSTPGTGVLQFPAATTSAGGITFGTDTNFYRSAAGFLSVDGSGDIGVNLRTGGVSQGQIAFSSSTLLVRTVVASPLALGYNSTAVITLTSATNATFSGTITKPGGTSPIITTNTAITSGAGVGVGTLTNAPASTNPTAWIPINDNGTTRYIPAW